MVSVTEAENIIQTHKRDFGVETLSFQDAAGRVLAQPIKADRDFPPFNRVTMDGIGISFAAWLQGERIFKIRNTQAAGEKRQDIKAANECIEIMTGASLPETIDTIVPYEDLDLTNGFAKIIAPLIKEGQNIHFKGKDIRQNEVLLPANCLLDAPAISIAASVGATELTVKKLPTVAVISTGNELVEPQESPSSTQIRRSNVYALEVLLKEFCVKPILLHLKDDQKQMEEQLTLCLKNYDVVLIVGGVSMGKFDHVPFILKKLAVKPLFHKVKQRPGKPFLFGSWQDHALVFALPGNPVSSFMCMIRYFVPWLRACLNMEEKNASFAVLAEDVHFNFPLQYFLQVKLSITADGSLTAVPCAGNSSGDLVNLLKADAFMELPMEENNFTKGQVFRVWPFKPIL